MLSGGKLGKSWEFPLLLLLLDEEGEGEEEKVVTRVVKEGPGEEEVAVVLKTG